MMFIWVIQITLGMTLSRKACMIPGSTRKFIKRILQWVNTTGNDHTKSTQCIHSGSLYFISYKLTISQTDVWQQKERSSYVDDETKAWCLSLFPRPCSFQVAGQLLAPWEKCSNLLLHFIWNTSILRIIVAISDKRGIAGFVSICSNEFIPPSWLQKMSVQRRLKCNYRQCFH
jgi:hypothetical protein